MTLSLIARASACVVMVAALASPASAAGEAPLDRALAESQFQEARRLMEAGRYAEACPKLADSYRLDPGLGTLLNLALCHEHEGRTASAWIEYTDAATEAARTGQAERSAYARAHASALEPRLSYVTLKVTPDDDGHVAEGLEVRLDGVIVGRASLGSALPADPGGHRVELTAPGRVPATQMLTVENGPWRGSVTLPRLELDRIPPTTEGAAPHHHPERAHEQPAPSGTPPGRIAGYALGGAGVLALAAGGYFGVRAIGWRDRRDSHCNAEHACDDDGLRFDDNARDTASLSTGLFVGGAAALAAGAILAFVVPWGAARSRAVAVGTMAGGPGLVFGGALP